MTDQIQILVRYDYQDTWDRVSAPLIERRKHNECIVALDGGRRYRAQRADRGPWCVTMALDRVN